MVNALIDEERAFYVRHGIALGGMDDMKNAFLLANIAAPDNTLTKDDLEVVWLKQESGITKSSNADDLWKLWLTPIYGNLAVDDLKLRYYINN